MGHDYYSLLGVERFASQETLRRAYRSRVLEVHPDHNPSDPAACERTRQIVEAYHVLSDPLRRRVYDLAVYQPADPRHIVTRPRHREVYCPVWATRLCVVVVFLAIVAAAAYGVRGFLDSRTMVFRPQLGAIDVSNSPHSPRLLGRSIAPHANDAHEDLASNVVARICQDTALADLEARYGIQLFATLTPPASL